MRHTRPDPDATEHRPSLPHILHQGILCGSCELPTVVVATFGADISRINEQRAQIALTLAPPVAEPPNRVSGDIATAFGSPLHPQYPDLMSTGADSMRVAIEMLTLWREQGEETARLGGAIQHILGTVMGGSSEAVRRRNAVTAVGGLLNLSDLLLLRLAEKQGAHTREEVELMAGEILRSVAAELPE